MEFENLSKENIVKQIVEKTGLSPESLEQKILEKKNKFAGLLTDSGAALMIAKELSIEIGEKQKTKIGQVLDGQKNVDVSCKVVHVFPMKKFDKNGKKGVLLNLAVSDETGEIRLTLWNDQALDFEKQKIERGDEIELTNCNVSSFNEKKQLSLGFGGTFKLAKKNNEHANTHLKDLQGQANSVDVYGTLERVFEEKTFSTQKGEGKLLAFLLRDDTASLRCVAWNDAIEEIKKAAAGMRVKIEGAYTKDGMNGPEINLGFASRVIVEPLAR